VNTKHILFRKIPFLLSLLIFAALTLPAFSLAQWTVMVYLDGDNNLEEYAINDFLEMAQIGSTSQVQVVVQLDRISGYDTRYDNWTEANRFYVTQGMTPKRSNAIADWGDGKGGREVNMGSPDTLVDFVSWAMQNYPASHYALILWDHGNGWKEVETTLNVLRGQLSWVSSPSERRKIKERIKELEGRLNRWKIEKSVCTDNSSGYDSLSLQELRWALEQLPGALNIIGFDACLMAMIEVAYEIRNFARVMVASQADEAGDGWPYDTILLELKNNPFLEAEELATLMVERYWEEYGQAGPATLSAVNLQGIFDLRQALDSLVTAIETAGDWLAPFIALQTTKRFDDVDYKDLKGFLQGCALGAADFSVRNLASRAVSQFQQVTVASRGPAGASGLSIYLPDYGQEISSQYHSDTLSFAESAWDEFLRSFQAADPFFQTEVFWEENFDRGLPANWTIIDGYGDGKTWSATNPGSRTIPVLTPPFMIVDSDWAGRVNMDESLITPVLSLPARPSYLVFQHYFRVYQEEKAEVDIKVSDGPWETLITFSGQDSSGLVFLNLGDYTDQENVQFRWRYYNANYEWYWAIDNVRVVARLSGRADGDLNQDGVVDITDVVLCLRMALGMLPVNLKAGDLDGDGTVSILDVIILLSRILE